MAVTQTAKNRGRPKDGKKETPRTRERWETDVFEVDYVGRYAERRKGRPRRRQEQERRGKEAPP